MLFFIMLAWNKRILKKTDRLLGPLLCKATGTLRAGAIHQKQDLKQSPIPADSLKRLLIIRPGGLGDAVLTFPMIKALHDHYSGTCIHVLAESRNADIFTINRHVKRVYRYDGCLPVTTWRMVRNRYDLVVDTEQFHHLSTFLAYVLRPTYLCGFASPIHQRLLTHPVLYGEDRYEIHSFLALAQSVTGEEYSFDPDETFVGIPASLQSWAHDILGPLDERPPITVIPSATAIERLWPTQKYAHILKWLIKKGYFPIILGGQDANDIAEVLSTGFQRNEVLNLAGRTSLAQTAALIQKARAHLSSDTGVLHLAYGLGTPTVSLFGPGLHNKWGPIGRRHVVIRANLLCSPCVQNGEIPQCPNGAACMEAISVEAVKTGLHKVLET